MNDEKLKAGQKAFRINLDALKYGTFAEIGAGQEVARWFFRVGGAAGTVAKTISAYDMAVSDAIYGPSDRYVSRQRLRSMLDYEFDLLLQRLDVSRGDHCTFFAFADTVTARSYSQPDEGHGWLGVKFQTEPHGPPSQIIIHVRMLDEEHVHQQEALGIVGVNLLHGAFYHHDAPTKLIGTLFDDLSWKRIEVDMIQLSGPCFAGVDNRLMSLQLVQQGLTDAAMFTADGEVVIPREVLYKKPVFVERGSFRPITHTTLDMLERGLEQFLSEPETQDETPVVLVEMTLRSVLNDPARAHRDFLDRVDTLSALGRTVLISNFLRYYRLVGYLSLYTQKMQGIALGVPSLQSIFDEQYYTKLEGGLLEALGRLFKGATKLYVYPYLHPSTGEVITAETLKVAPHLRHLYAHLIENRHIVSIRNYNPDFLSIYPNEVLDKIRSGDAAWERLVPPPIVEIIKQKKLFTSGPKQAALGLTTYPDKPAGA